MDMRNLSYFIAVAKFKSFTKASENIHISQSALSKAVKNLEDELKVTLIDRSSRNIKLTDAGEIVFEKGLKIKESFHDLTLELYDLMNLEQGEIKIGIPPIIGYLFFPKILKGFNSLYPNIKIHLSEEGAEKIKQEVRDGLIDLGIVMLPADPEEFEVTPFIQDEFTLFINRSHPLAQKDQIEMKELKNEKFIIFKKGFTLHKRILQECQDAGFSPNVAYECSEWDFMSGLIGENLGISIFPRLVIHRIDPEVIKSIEIVNPRMPWQLGIIVKKGKYASFAIREFIQYINSQVLDQKIVASMN